MNPNEKRHFRLYVQKGAPKSGKLEENRYIRLFDILEAQSEFNDEAARKKLAVSSAGGYARIKNYLYGAILEALEDYYRDSTLDARFMHAMNQANILKSRQLYGQAGKMYRKAMKLADDKGIGFYRLMVERMELDRLCQVEDFKGIEQFLEEYEERKLKSVERGIDHTDLQMIKAKMTYLLRYRETGKHRHQEWLEELADHPLLREVKHPDDLEYRLYYDNLNGLVHGLLGNTEKDLYHRQSYLDTYQSNPEYIIRWPANYIVALGNVAEGAADQGDYSTVLSCTQEMRDFLDVYQIKNRKSLEPTVKLRSRALELYAWDTLSSDERTKLYEQLQVTLKKHGRRAGKLWRYLIRVGLARYDFDRGEHSKVLDWVRPILQAKDDALLPQTQLTARLFLLMSHYELGNRRFVEHGVPNLRDWIKKQKFRSPIATDVLRLISGAIRRPDQKAPKESWEKLQKCLDEHGDNPDHRWLIKSLSWNQWISSHL